MVWVPDPRTVKVELWPPKPRGGMNTGSIPVGVRITHLPTGEYAVCDKHRSQSENRKQALEDLAKILDARERVEAENFEAQQRREKGNG